VTSKPAWHEELLMLCGAVRDETLSLGDRGRLEQLLNEYAEARTYYVQFFQLDACLQWHSLALPNVAQDFDLHSTGIAPSETGNTSKLPRPAGVVLGLLNAVSRRAPGGGLTVGLLVVFVIVAAFWGLSLQMLHPQKPSGATRNDATVAMVTSAADVHWSPETKPKTNNSAIHSSEPLKISSGIVQVELKSGATLLVEGPAQWSIDDDNRATLESGKIVAKVPSQAVGFTIQTPTATVIDLGTEFGVEVTPEQESRLQVFQGKIVVRANVAATSSAGTPREIELREGEAVIVEPHGTAVRYSRAEAQAAVDAKRFVRNVPKKVVKIFNLVDAVAGGNGFGRARDRGIDATTGKSTLAQVAADTSGLLVSDGGYHRVEGLPFIDGVFIPRSKSAVQLDSAGHTFANFPSSDNNTWGYIWAGGVIPQHSVEGVNKGTIPASLEGVDYSASWHSLLSLHANKGITFDLQAIRKANPHCKISRFVSTAGNAANPLASDGTKWCEVWVFVDGQSQFRRERITAQQEFTIAVELNEESRFLSLVATDGGDGFGWDHVIFVDPYLVLNEAPIEKR
jgi:hypothetical protein